MKKLVSLNGDGNWCRFDRGNDGDMHIIMGVTEEHYGKKYKGIMHSVRVGVGNSGGQEVPFYVKEALSNLVVAFNKWEKEDDDENQK